MRFGLGAILILAITFLGVHPAPAATPATPVAQFTEVLQPYLCHHHHLGHHGNTTAKTSSLVLAKSENESPGATYTAAARLAPQRPLDSLQIYNILQRTLASSLIFGGSVQLLL